MHYVFIDHNESGASGELRRDYERTAASMRLERRLNRANIVLWSLFHCGAALCFIVPPSFGAIAVALVLYYLTFGLGMSAGIHRGLVHQSYATYKWVEYLLAVLGTLAGLGGPVEGSREHFVRDFCQSNLGIENAMHSRSFIKNYCYFLFWHSEISPPPDDATNRRLSANRFYQLLEHRVVLHSLLGALLFLAGGLPYVVWGLFVRVVIIVNLFACLDHFGHAAPTGYRRFRIPGVSNEGKNNWLLGIALCGEGWHNNHHARPAAAAFGIAPGELDLGYAFIAVMKRVGLVWRVVEPTDHALKPGAVLNPGLRT